MSDSWQGPGWWRSTDGQWYPPERHPDYVPRAAPHPVEHVAPAGASAGDLLSPSAMEPDAVVGAPNATLGLPPTSLAGPAEPHGQARRWVWLLVAVVVVVVVVVGVAAVFAGSKGSTPSSGSPTPPDTAGHSTPPSTSPAAAPGATSTPAPGATTAPSGPSTSPLADVSISACTVDPADHSQVNVSGRTVNSTSGTQDYTIRVTLLINGFDAGVAIADDSVGPKQSSPWSATGVMSGSNGALTCRLATVSRTPTSP